MKSKSDKISEWDKPFTPNEKRGLEIAAVYALVSLIAMKCTIPESDKSLPFCWKGESFSTKKCRDLYPIPYLF